VKGGEGIGDREVRRVKGEERRVPACGGLAMTMLHLFYRT
jgi:hypothetical protein